MIGYSREMRKKLQNVEDLSDDDADLYMALGYNANKEASQASKILKEYEEIEQYLYSLNIENGYIQELGEHEEEYVPKWGI